MNEARPANARLPLLVIAGNDPSGGAGIAADLQAASALGLHPLPVITSITAQDTRDVVSVHPVPPAQVTEQLHVLLDDISPAAVKIGLLPSEDVALAVVRCLRERLSAVPTVVDPVLKAGGGGRLADDPLAKVLREEILAEATVTTPNRFELARLVDSDEGADPQTQAAALARQCACAVLVTGADVAADLDQPVVRNYAALADGTSRQWTWPRLPGRFHGSGCTLAAALACELAKGEALGPAMEAAQRYTASALSQAIAPGRGQFIPGRMIK
ncbi:MAG: hydroxymethylpyrimidine/phosphomethylpyrimidine kinase [Pseudomonadota bacterium]